MELPLVASSVSEPALVPERSTGRRNGRAGPAGQQATLLQVFTLVVALVCQGVGWIGLALRYPWPHPRLPKPRSARRCSAVDQRPDRLAIRQPRAARHGPPPDQPAPAPAPEPDVPPLPALPQPSPAVAFAVPTDVPPSPIAPAQSAPPPAASPAARRGSRAAATPAHSPSARVKAVSRRRSTRPKPSMKGRKARFSCGSPSERTAVF